MTLGQTMIETIKFSLSWANKKEYWKYYGILAVLFFFANLFDVESISVLLQDKVTGVPLVIAAIAVMTIAYILLIYVSLKVSFKALEQKVKLARPLNLSTIAGMFVVGILTSLAAMFSVFELQWLLLLIIGVALAVGAFIIGSSNLIVAFLLGGIAVVLLAIYFVVYIRNLMRLTAALGRYLQGAPMMQSIKQSWNMTSRKALKIFVIFIGLYVIIMAVTFIQLIPSMFAGIGDIFVNLLGVPINPFTALLAGVFSPAVALIEAFFYAGVYKWIVDQTSSKPANVPRPAKVSTPATIAKRPVKPVTTKKK